MERWGSVVLSYAVLKASSVGDGAPSHSHQILPFLQSCPDSQSRTTQSHSQLIPMFGRDALASRSMHSVNVQSRCALFQTKPLELLNPNQVVPNVMESNAHFSGFEKFISPFFTNLCVGGICGSFIWLNKTGRKRQVSGHRWRAKEFNEKRESCYPGHE